MYIFNFARRPPHFHANMHAAMIRILPVSQFLHCGFSLWAYGAPEIWPEGRYERIDSSGTKHYYPEERSFSERIFNENSFPFFILL
jgi:hypothetical protein